MAAFRAGLVRKARVADGPLHKQRSPPGTFPALSFRRRRFWNNAVPARAARQDRASRNQPLPVPFAGGPKVTRR